MHYYFAYGSNIGTEAMARRAPGAGRIGRSRLDGHELFLARSGYLSIRPAERHSVLGVLWQIDGDAERALDDYEGVGEGLYGKRIVRISEPEVDALVYVESSGVEGSASHDGYLESVAAAMTAESFPPDYVARLRSFARGRTDTTSSRESSTSKISSKPSS